MGYTLKQCKKDICQMWKWLSENPTKNKDDFPKAPTDYPEFEQGECRRRALVNLASLYHAGTVSINAQETMIIKTNEEYWCGEWEIKGNSNR